MARTTKKRWSYLSGEKGRNRVRAYERGSGALMLEFRDRGRRTRITLDHRDRDRAKRQADEAAAGLAKAEVPVAERPKERTLGELFDMYLEEVTPRNGKRHQDYDRRATKMILSYFGSDRAAMTLNRRDWDRFIRERGSGRVGPGEEPWKPVNNRTVQKDLSFMASVFNWATMAGDGQGDVLLERNPFKGYRLPREKNPLRVVLTEVEYEALLAVSAGVDWRFQVALVLANETGHRIGAIRKLRWSDVNVDDETICWRAENEKTGYEQVTPMSREAKSVFEFARTRNSNIGERAVLPAPKDPTRPVGRYLMRDWWQKAEARAELGTKRGRGWHSVRRKFATDLAHAPLSVLCRLGGWRDTDTVLRCYQRPDDDDLRAALERRSGSVERVQRTQRTDTGARLKLVE